MITFGSNKYGQLGLGDFKAHDVPSVVSGSLLGQRVANVSCGDGFTVIATHGEYIVMTSRPLTFSPPPPNPFIPFNLQTLSPLDAMFYGFLFLTSALPFPLFFKNMFYLKEFFESIQFNIVLRFFEQVKVLRSNK